jgi:MFS family permease
MVVSAVLIFCQAFFFNSLYYKYPLILADMGVAENDGTVLFYAVGMYMIQLSIVSFLGPVLIGPLFDTVGRRRMCLLTCKICFYYSRFIWYLIDYLVQCGSNSESSTYSDGYSIFGLITCSFFSKFDCK